MGENYFKVSFSDGFGFCFDVICFGVFDGLIGFVIDGYNGKWFYLVGKLDVNIW